MTACGRIGQNNDINYLAMSGVLDQIGERGPAAINFQPADR